MAQYNLANCYFKGFIKPIRGQAYDYPSAVKWYRKAAEQGLDIAQLMLGKCYSSGQGVELNYEEATKWYQKAAEQGNTDALTNLKAIASKI